MLYFEIISNVIYNEDFESPNILNIYQIHPLSPKSPGFICMYSKLSNFSNRIEVTSNSIRKFSNRDFEFIIEFKSNRRDPKFEIFESNPSQIRFDSIRLHLCTRPIFKLPVYCVYIFRIFFSMIKGQSCRKGRDVK